MGEVVCITERKILEKEMSIFLALNHWDCKQLLLIITIWSWWEYIQETLIPSKKISTTHFLLPPGPPPSILTCFSLITAHNTNIKIFSIFIWNYSWPFYAVSLVLKTIKNIHLQLCYMIRNYLFEYIKIPINNT